MMKDHCKIIEGAKGYALSDLLVSESINLRYILQEDLIRAKTVLQEGLIRAKTVSSSSKHKSN